MHIRIVPAAIGIHWFTLGFRMLWRQPLAWMLLLLPFAAYFLLLPFIPWGAILNTALWPLSWLLLMEAVAQVYAGRSLRPATLLAAFSGHRRSWYAMLALSALSVIAILVPLMLTTLIDGGEVAAFVLRTSQGAALPENEWLLNCWFAWTSILYSALWFTPGLIHWHGIAPLQALRLSMMAYLRNWRAFLF